MKILDLHEIGRDEVRAELEDSIDLASDQDEMTWLDRAGTHIAAIVPVDLVEYALRHGYMAGLE